MKALKHSLVHKTRRFAEDETVTPYGMMTSLQVHVRGYVPSYDEETGLGKSIRVDVRRGAGPETYFKNLGKVKSESVVKNLANVLFQQYVNDPKVLTDGSLLGHERHTETSFSRPGKNPNKKHNKKSRTSGSSDAPKVEFKDNRRKVAGVTTSIDE